MKIAVISTPVFQLSAGGGLKGYGGLEQIAWEQARGLAAKGHDVLLVAPDGSECPGVTVVPCGPAGGVSEQESWGGFPEVRGDGEGPKPGQPDTRPIVRRQHQGYWQALLGVDAVVDHSWCKWAYHIKAEGVLKAPVLGWFHAPVNTMYHSWPPAFPGMPPVDKACPVCISEDQAANFQALHNRPARVCYNGCDVENFYKPIPGVKRTDRFLFLARFSTIKGPHLAIEACRKAGVGLDLIGDTSITNEPAYYEQCRAMCDGKQIRLVGPCSRGEAVYWYSQAHAFLHSAKTFREPFGLAPVEAMACGLPVVCYDNGALRETVVQGRTGVVCKTDEEFTNIVRSMKDRDLNLGVGVTRLSWWHNQDMREECRNNALRFTLDRMVTRVEELCKEAVECPW